MKILWTEIIFLQRNIFTRNLAHFSILVWCNLRMARKRKYWNLKKPDFREPLGFCHFFNICNIPLPSAPNWHAKCLDIFQPGAVRIQCLNAWMKQVQPLSLPVRSTLKWNVQIWKVAESWNIPLLNTEILRDQAIFQICNIPLLCAPKWYANCLGSFPVGHSEDLYLSTWTKRVNSLSKPIWLDVNVAHLKKVSDSRGSQDSATFFRFAIFNLYML